MKSMQCMCIDLFLSPIVMVAVSQYHLSISSTPHLVPACSHALLWVSQYHLSISSTPHLVPACSHALLWDLLHPSPSTCLQSCSPRDLGL